MKDAVAFGEIPTIRTLDTRTDIGLPVWADDLPARVFLMDRGFASTKIVVAFEEPHPLLGDRLYTKYFRVRVPGYLEWGVPIRVVEMKHRNLEVLACPWG